MVLDHRTHSVAVCSAKRGATQRRAGASTLESIIALPVLVILIVATIQFSIATLVGQAVTHAATVGAREASQGANIDQVKFAVERILAAHRITIGANASVILENPATAPVIQQRGSLACAPSKSPKTADLAVNERRVTVCVAMTSAPMLNRLKTLGLDLAGKKIVRSSLVRSE